jgi:hypothetical protein
VIWPYDGSDLLGSLKPEASMKASRFVAVLMVGAFVLAACGGGGDPEAVSPAAGDGGGDTGGDTGEVGGVFDATECAQVVSAMGAAAAAVPQAMSGGGGDLDQSLAQLQAFAEAAPEEIRADLMLVYEGYGAYMAAMQDAGYDPTSGEVPSAEVIAAMEAASAQLSAPEFTAASERVSAWFETNCGA